MASNVLAIPSPVAKSITIAAGLVGCWYVGLRIPTRERVLAARGDGGGGPGDQPAQPSSATNTSRISAEGLASGSDDGRR